MMVSSRPSTKTGGLATKPQRRSDCRISKKLGRHEGTSEVARNAAVGGKGRPCSGVPRQWRREISRKGCDDGRNESNRNRTRKHARPSSCRRKKKQRAAVHRATAVAIVAPAAGAGARGTASVGASWPAYAGARGPASAGAGAGGAAGAGAGGAAGAGDGPPADAGAGGAAHAGVAGRRARAPAGGRTRAPAGLRTRARRSAARGCGEAAYATAGAGPLEATTLLPCSTGSGRGTGARVCCLSARPETVASGLIPESNLDKISGPPAPDQRSTA